MFVLYTRISKQNKMWKTNCSYFIMTNVFDYIVIRLDIKVSESFEIAKIYRSKSKSSSKWYNYLFRYVLTVMKIILWIADERVVHTWKIERNMMF